MPGILKRHFHPLGGRILFWNLALLVFVKFILPHSPFQLATILEQGPIFDSRDVIEETNRARVENGLPPLRSNFQLDLAATEKFKDMAIKEYFAHISPDGVTPWFWIKDSNYTYTIAGENLAIGFFNAEDTVDAWLKSSSHRANLLSTNYEDIGVAVGRAEINDKAGIIVVQMFGTASQITAAQPVQTIEPTPTPALPTPIQSPEQQVAASEDVVTLGNIDIVKSEPQPVTTEVTAKTVSGPIPFGNAEVVKINHLISTTNLVFIFYTFTMALAAIVLFFMFDRKRLSGAKVLAHVNVFLMAVLISAADVYIEAFIF